MEEKVLGGKKNGMLVLLLGIVMVIACVAFFVVGGMEADAAEMEGRSQTLGIALVCLGILTACFIWVPFCSIKVLKPQEALVLTLFGKYVGTLKGDGFYAVNPFCKSFLA